MNAAIYARYSSDNQREESIDAQIRAATDFAKQNGYTIVKTYTDHAKTATSDNRPGFQEMFKEIDSGLFEAIIIHKLDRFSRDRYDSAIYRQKLRKQNIQLISVLERFDNSPESVVLESVLEGFAEYYSKNLSREVKKGMCENAYQCKHTGGIPPLGYNVGPDRRYVINEAEAEAVTLIFESFAAGYGYKKICAQLKINGYKSKKGKDFTPTSLHDILRNEKYTGVYIFNRTVSKVNGLRNNHASKAEEDIIRIPGGMPAIISKELFSAVRKKMGNSKLNAQNKAIETYLLSGKIVCGQCGAAMVGHTSNNSGRNKTKYSTYHCGNRYRTKNCSNKPVNRDEIEKVVLQNLQQKLSSQSAIEHLADNILAHYQKIHSGVNREIELAHKQQNSIEKKIQNIVSAIANGTFSATLTTALESLESEKAVITATLKSLQQRKSNDMLSRAAIVDYLSQDIGSLENKKPDDLKKIIQTYVEKVVVYEERVEVFLFFFVHTNGGGEGSRTPVQKHCHIGVSERSR